MAARENLNTDLAELIAQKMIAMSIPEDQYLQDRARSYQARRIGYRMASLKNSCFYALQPPCIITHTRWRNWADLHNRRKCQSEGFVGNP